MFHFRQTERGASRRLEVRTVLPDDDQDPASPGPSRRLDNEQTMDEASPANDSYEDPNLPF